MPEDDANFASSRRAKRGDWSVQLIGSALTFLGVFFTGMVTLSAAIIGASANHQPGQNEGIGPDIRAGFQAIGKAISERKLDVVKPTVIIAPCAPTAPAIQPSSSSPQPAIPQPSEAKTGSIEDGTCSGLDTKTWSIQIAPVTRLKGKDQTSHDLLGYNINARLSNLGDRALYIKYANAELTDDQGNQLALTSTSLPPNNLTPPTEVTAGAELPINLRFLGSAASGKSVSFSVNLHIYSEDEKPKIDKFETLGCTNLPA